MLTSTNVCPEIFHYIEEVAVTLSVEDKYIILAFEEFAYNKELFLEKYNENCPNYYVIFAIQSINKTFYQPLACILWNRKTMSDMADLIRVLIHALYLSGFTVVSTVCRHRYTMCSVVEHLIQPTSEETPKILTYSVGPVTDIIHIFDTSVLLMDVRHKFLNGIFYFKMDNKYYYAYKDVVQTLLDEESIDLFIPRSTIYAEPLDSDSALDSVKLFSKLVADNIAVYVNKGVLHPRTLGTAKFCLFFDELFNSFNTFTKPTGKFEKVIHANNHETYLTFWNNALDILKTMYVYFNNSKKLVLAKGEGITNLVDLKNCSIEISSNSPNKTYNDSTETQSTSGKKKKKGKTADNNNNEESKNCAENKYKYLSKCAQSKFLHYLHENFTPFDQPSCINLWMVNINGILKIIENLREKSFDSISLQNFNVDPILTFVNLTIPQRRKKKCFDGKIRTFDLLDEVVAQEIFEPNYLLHFDDDHMEL